MGSIENIINDYTPTNWQSGDLVSSTRLNKAEQGIATGRVQIFEIETNNWSADQTNITMREIYDVLVLENLPILKIINTSNNNIVYYRLVEGIFLDSTTEEVPFYQVRILDRDFRITAPSLDDTIKISLVYTPAQ